MSQSPAIPTGSGETGICYSLTERFCDFEKDNLSLFLKLYFKKQEVDHFPPNECIHLFLTFYVLSQTSCDWRLPLCVTEGHFLCSVTDIVRLNTAFMCNQRSLSMFCHRHCVTEHYLFMCKLIPSLCCRFQPVCGEQWRVFPLVPAVTRLSVGGPTGVQVRLSHRGTPPRGRQDVRWR